MFKLIAIITLLFSSLYPDAVKESTDASVKRRVMNNPYFKNILPKEIIKFVNNNKQEKPIFILFSSQDGRCGPCLHLNRTMYQVAKTQHQKIDFVSVDFYPWWEIRDLPEVSERYSIVGVPFGMIIYQDKIISHIQGGQNQAGINTFIDTVLQEVKDKRNLERFSNHLQTGSINSINSTMHQFKIQKKYLNFQGYKAMALVLGSNNRYTNSWKIKFLSQKEANQMALTRCEERRKEKGIDSECKLYMVGDKYVYGKSDKEIELLMAKMPEIETVLDKNLQKFYNKKNYKAFALARDDDGKWRSSSASGHKKQKTADKSALDKCEKKRLKKNIKSACKIITRGEKL